MWSAPNFLHHFFSLFIYRYPRPSLTRSSHTWLNLNGIWDYAVTTVEEPDGIDGIPLNTEYDGKIKVPFCVESALSGVQMPLPLAESLSTDTDADGQPIFTPHKVALWYIRQHTYFLSAYGL